MKFQLRNLTFGCKKGQYDPHALVCTNKVIPGIQNT